MKAGLRAVAVALQVTSGDALNLTLGVIEAGESAVSVLGARDRSLARHVADAAKKLNAASYEFTSYDVDSGFVEHILSDALAARSPFQTFTDVIRGGNAFTSAVRAEIDEALPAADGLTEAQSSYLTALCSFVHDALTSILEDPARLPAPLIAVIEAQGGRMAENSQRLDEHDRAIRELFSRLGEPHGSRIIGDRPRLIEPRVDRPEVNELIGMVNSDTVLPIVISGMRGVGKSQLAASVAEHCEADSWDLVAWVSARTREGLVSELCRVGSAYGIDHGEDSRATAAAVVDRLTRTDGERRLIVFDNIERFDDISLFVPRSGTRVIVTTTRANSPWGPVIALDTFTAPEAADYLDAAAPGIDPTTSAEIASELGHLPLALTQASATMSRLGLSGEDYLDALRQQPITSTLRRFDGDSYPASVEAALVMSIESALHSNDEDAGFAERMLTATAFLSEDGFPARALLAIGNDELSARATRATLIEHGILRSGEYEQTLSLHRLFARVIGDRAALVDAPTLVHDLALTVATLLMPRDDPGVLDRDRVSESANQLASIERMKTALPEVADSTELHRLVIACASDAVGARMRDAALMLEPWQAAIAASPTSTIEDALALPSCIARTHAQAGDAARGVKMYEDALEKASSAEFPPVRLAELRSALASALRHSGRTEESIALSRETIAELSVIVDDSDGEDREYAVKLLRSMRNNLAGTLRVSGYPDEAITLYDQLLTTSDEENASDLLKVRSNRLQALKDTGALAAAIDGYGVLLIDLKDAVGEDHADWVIAHGNMAVAIANFDDGDRGLAMLIDSADRHDRILGDEDRLSIEAHVQLAHALRDRGRLEASLEHLWIAHRRSCVASGSESATSIGSGFHLACTLFETSRWGEALRVGVPVLRDRRDETLSATSTALLRIYLGYAQVNLRNPRRALPLLQRGIEEYSATPSPDVPTLALARQVLAALENNAIPPGVIVGAMSGPGGPLGRQTARAGLAFHRENE